MVGGKGMRTATHIRLFNVFQLKYKDRQPRPDL